MPFKVNLAHHPFHAFGGGVDLGHVLRRGRAAFFLAKPWPSSSNRSAEAFA
jgi:hypothetical protein